MRDDSKPALERGAAAPTASRRSSCVAAALALLFSTSLAHAQCWLPGPAHGTNGTLYPAKGWTIWDVDGAGPLAPTLVIGTPSGVEAWVGAQFVAIGGSPVGEIRCLAVYGGQLYAGGAFTKIGSDPVINLARWDGSHWVQVGDGLTTQGDPHNPQGAVNAMMVLGGILYLGGSLTPVDSGVWTSFVTWNGSALSGALSTQAPISNFLVVSSQLYASCTAGVPGVYRFDTSAWTRLGSLADKSILAVAYYNNSIYAGGQFTHFFTGVPIVGIARWDGTQWQPVGAGIGPAGSEVTSLAVNNGWLYAAGKFATMDGKTVSNVAQFNSDWYAMGYGIQLALNVYGGGIENLALYNGEVDALGYIDGAGFYPDTNVTRWNGTDWLPFIAGVNGSVRCLLSSGTTLYAGGDFAFTWGTSNVNHVLGTDGSSISSFTTLTGFSGVNGSVRALGLHKFSPMIPSLVVGGSFSTAGSVAAANVALFGNGTWAQVGGGFNNSVFALADYSNTLYAAGAFTASGITPLTHLAKYVSGSWVNPGAGAFNNINALMVTGGKLIIGGVPGGEGVSAWNGVSLTSYGSANGPVNALATYNGDIIAGGSFTTIGGQSAVSVARRDSATGVWHAMAQGLPNGAVYALAVHATHLYAGGNFVISGSPNIVRLAEWTGTSWVPIGTNSGLDGDVVSLASFNGRLHVGGFFNQSLDHVLSPYWIEHDASGCDVAVEPRQDARGTVLRWSYPNPARHLSRLDFSLESPGRARLAVFDVTGREVKLLHDGWYDAGEHEVVWDGTNEAGRPSPAGIYFYRLDADGRSLSEETVRVR